MSEFIQCPTCQGSGRVYHSDLETPKGSGATYIGSECSDCRGQGGATV